MTENNPESLFIEEARLKTTAHAFTEASDFFNSLTNASLDPPPSISMGTIRSPARSDNNTCVGCWLAHYYQHSKHRVHYKEFVDHPASYVSGGAYLAHLCGFVPSNVFKYQRMDEHMRLLTTFFTNNPDVWGDSTGEGMFHWESSYVPKGRLIATLAHVQARFSTITSNLKTADPSTIDWSPH